MFFCQCDGFVEAGFDGNVRKDRTGSFLHKSDDFTECQYATFRNLKENEKEVKDLWYM